MNATPLFAFAAIADVQYADEEGELDFRGSLERLEACVADLAGRDLAFVVQLGDVIQGRAERADSRSDLERVLAPLEGLGVPLVHVVGNHCLALPRAELEARLGLERGWQSFARDGWRFVVIDSMELSLRGVPPDHPRARDAAEWLAAHAIEDFPHANEWNGGVSVGQLTWLCETLAAAAASGERAVVFGHHPVALAAARPNYLMWTHTEVRAALEESESTVAYFCGHDHRGGYARSGSVHHCTLPGMVAAPRGSNAYAVVEVFGDRLVVRGVGEVGDRVLVG